MKNSRSDRRQIPVTEMAQPTGESPIAVAPETDGSDGNDDPTASLQADLDRFRDLALRSQADFDNYKKRATREKEDAVKYANSALLERLIAIVDNFELGLSAAKSEGARSPIYSGMRVTSWTAPAWAKRSCRSVSVVLKERFPTYNLVPI